MDAEKLQKMIAERVVTTSGVTRLDLIAGCDVAYRGHLGCAAVALLSCPNMDTLEVVRAAGEVAFPYVPGFLAFRESPLILAALTSPTILLYSTLQWSTPSRFREDTSMSLAVSWL